MHSFIINICLVFSVPVEILTLSGIDLAFPWFTHVRQGIILISIRIRKLKFTSKCAQLSHVWAIEMLLELLPSILPVRRNTGTHRNTGRHWYLPEHTISEGVGCGMGEKWGGIKGKGGRKEGWGRECRITNAVQLSVCSAFRLTCQNDYLWRSIEIWKRNMIINVNQKVKWAYSNFPIHLGLLFN